MRYAAMRGQGSVTVTVPQLNGGVNLSDLPTRVEDNQLTDSLNMWWHQGALRTRPGLEKMKDEVSPKNYFTHQNPISERECVLMYVKETAAYISADVYCSVFNAADGMSYLGKAPIDLETSADGPSKTASAFGVKIADNPEDEVNAPYLFFTGDGNIWRGRRDAVIGGDDSMNAAEPYVPTVLVNGRGLSLEEWLETGNFTARGDVFESYNMLTGDFKCTFTTDGKARYFKLPQSELDIQPMEIELTLYDSKTEELYETSVTVNAGASKKKTETIYNVPLRVLGFDLDGDDGEIWVTIDRLSGEVEIYGSHLSNAAYRMDKPLPPFGDNASNNLKITARKTHKGQKETIGGMQRAVWFGGDRSGLGGGTRLFVAGNPQHPNLVHWSHVNNPLYFPEDNCMYVGSADQAVTAFGKQSDLLVIFKEHELYCTQYVVGDDEDIAYARSGNQGMETYMAQFPLTPIHSSIGCDCPDTIQLVNNRLVWVTSDAHVYMLTSVNQYSERNVRDITALVRRELEKHTAAELQNAVATEYAGHYMLMLPYGETYLLDVGNSAFQSYAYYSSEKKANRALPWYIWHLGGNNVLRVFYAAVTDGDNVRLLINERGSLRSCRLQGTDDVGGVIPCHFTTKLFDFGRRDMKKAITQIYLGVADSPPNEVHVSYITDEYTAEDAYLIEARGDREEREPGHMRTHRLTPNVHRVQTFGLRCDSEGTMAVDSIQIKMKPQGVVR